MLAGCTEPQPGQKNRSWLPMGVPHCQQVRSRSAGRPLLAASSGAGSAVCAARLLVWKPRAAARGGLQHGAAAAAAAAAVDAAGPVV